MRASLRRNIANAAPVDLDQLVSEDSEKHDRRRQLDVERALLEAVLAADAGEEREIGDGPIDMDHNLYVSEREAFPDMLARVQSGRTLTPKQLGWVKAAAERLDVNPGVVSIPVNAGVPRGREVEPAPALRQLPLAPPGRKATPFQEQLDGPRFGPQFGFRQEGGSGYTTERWHPGQGLPTAVGQLPHRDWVNTISMLLGVEPEKVRVAYQRVIAMRSDPKAGPYERTPEGDINNCALMHGEMPESLCQICRGNCPDRGVFIERSRTPLRAQGADEPTPRDIASDYSDDDVPF